MHGRTRLTTIAMVLGMLLVIVGLTRDWVLPTTSRGFGKNQFGLLAVGCVVLVVGVALRVDLIAIGSMLLIAIAILADILGDPGAPGVGWKQEVAWELGVLVVAVAWLIRRRRSRRRRAGTAKVGSVPVADG